MTPYFLEEIRHSASRARQELVDKGLPESADNLAPIICTMLQTLLRHCADVEDERLIDTSPTPDGERS